MNRFVRRSTLGAAVVAAVGAATLIAPGAASAVPTQVYVGSGSPASTSSCAHPDFGSIQAGIDAVAPGGTVVVCPGTYPGLVNVDRRVTLRGQGDATVDATGMPYGIGVSASYATVRDLRVVNASDTADGPADGIVTAAFGPFGPVVADHVRILGNTVTGNLGSGIDLNSTNGSTASGNVAVQNGVGINVADDFGVPAQNNVISSNTTNENFGGCGIALADHTGAGVINNLIAYNVSNDNGLSTPTAPDASAGSGIILASPIPGGVVRNNRVMHNSFDGNGHGGVVVHSHAPGADFRGNSVTDNRVGTNNLRTDTGDLQTTGIYLGSVSLLTIRVSGNVIGPDYYGIFTAGRVQVQGYNTYQGVLQNVRHIPSY